MSSNPFFKCGKKFEILPIDSKEGLEILKEHKDSFPERFPQAFYSIPSKKIFVDLSAPLGSLLSVIVHEGQHAIDDSVYPKDTNHQEEIQRTLLMEHRAYRAQGSLDYELKVLHPYFHEEYLKEKIKTQENFDLVFRQVYRFPKEMMDKHFRKHPWMSFD